MKKLNKFGKQLKWTIEELYNKVFLWYKIIIRKECDYEKHLVYP